jgi:hypothetical protein
MRNALFGVVAVAALAFAGPASAGCWATADLAPPPQGTAAGEVWTAEVIILQHGRNPLPDAGEARPKVTIVNVGDGERHTFTARPTNVAAGLYEARVVFPSSGAWRYEVFDGFTSWNGEPAPCAQTHAFAAAQIGGPGAAESSGFPLWPVAGGLGGLLAAGLGLGFLLRRHGARSPAAA